MKKLVTLLSCLLCLSTIVWAEKPLTKDDYKNLKKLYTIEHILYEAYLETDQGLASVFGYHFDTFFTDEIYLATAIFGAVGGDRGGYGIAAVGVGLRLEIAPRIFWDSKFLIGSGGGGGLRAGGGFAVEPQSGLSYAITDRFFFDVKGGYLTFPSGSFSTPIVHFGVSYATNRVILPFR